jgi:hypothetical protein
MQSYAIPTKRIFQVRGRRGADATRHRRSVSFPELRLAGWDSSVGIATGYELNGRGSIPDKGLGLFSSTPQHPDQLWVPTSHISNGYWVALSLGLKRSGHEADRSPPFSVEVENGGTIPSLALKSSWRDA